MRKMYKKAMAGLLAVAMVLTSGAFSSEASAAKKKMQLSSKKVTLSVGKTKKLSVKNAPKKAKFTWKSSKKKVAKVSKTGKVTAIKEGKAKITCTVAYKSSGKKKSTTLTANVTVKAKASTDASAVETSTQPSANTVVSQAPVAPSVAPSADASTEPSADVSAEPEKTPVVTSAPTPEPTLEVCFDDTSNIGEEREVSIVGGTSDTMIVKDNGSMRKELSSQDLIKNEMGEGINLGNTMEATKALADKDKFTEATDFEQAWGAPITTQAYIDSVHSYGFNTLRIPVAWSSMVSKDGNYTIDEKMLGRVEEIVNYALNNGMYVIINDHWDYGWWGQFGSDDDKVVENAWKRYKSYWNQITERFKDYSDHLIFESANEELGDRLNDRINADGYSAATDTTKGTLTEKECYEMTNKINQTFLDIVRNSGGNNKYRHLLIAGYNTNIEKTCNSKFIMPTDIEENGTSKLSVSVHYYDPWGFCGDGNSGKYTQKDKTHHVQQFDLLNVFTDAGYGVIVGEFGVCNPKQDGVADWLYDVMNTARAHGCLPVLWETPGMYFDRENNVMLYKDIAELYNAATNSHGDAESQKYSTGKPNAKLILSDSLPEGKEPVWKWEGYWSKNDGNNIGIDGEEVKEEDVSKFVQTAECTDDSKIEFNTWGYQTYLKMDWKNIKQPAIMVTFKENTIDSVGNLQLSTTGTAGKTGVDKQIFNFSEWDNKVIGIPVEMTDSLKVLSYLEVTFTYAPVVTGIYVYDMAEE